MAGVGNSKWGRITHEVDAGKRELRHEVRGFLHDGVSLSWLELLQLEGECAMLDAPGCPWREQHGRKASDIEQPTSLIVSGLILAHETAVAPPLMQRSSVVNFFWINAGVGLHGMGSMAQSGGDMPGMDRHF